MKAEDLMIGNYLFKEGIIVKIDARTIFDICNDEEFKKYKPIPLNESELERLGFTRCKGWDDMYFWCLESKFENENRFELFEVEKGFETPSGAIVSNVHVLQSCFYFHYLTGKQLVYVK